MKPLLRKFLDKTIRGLSKVLRSSFLRAEQSHEERLLAHGVRLSNIKSRNGRLSGKIAIITGGASGIGRAIAILFAREGAKVVIADLKPGAVDEILAEGGEAVFIQTDVSVEEQVRNLIEKTIQLHGSLNVLVNNAGVNIVGNVVTLPAKEWQRGIDVNLTSAYLCCHYAIPHMLKSPGGSIVMIASLTAMAGIIGGGVYGTSKAALVGLAQQTAREFAREGLRVNSVSPGNVMTPMFTTPKWAKENARIISEYTPMGHLALPEDIAYACLYLASDEASYVTGANFVIDGGANMRGT